MNIHSERWEHYFFEIAYWALLLLTIVGMIAGAALSNGWLRGFSFVGFLIGIWSGFIEPRLITTARYRLALVKEPKTWVRVAFVSDLHAGLRKRRAFFARAVGMMLALRPDMVLIGGDLVEEAADPLSELEPLSRLEAPLGKYFILGNHDYIDDPDVVDRQMRAWGFASLINERCLIQKEGRSLELVGLDDSWLGKPDVRLLRRAEKSPRLLLLHEPDNLSDVSAGDADAIVMGHTHGGQVRLPFIGSVRHLPQNVSQKYDRGLRDWMGIPVVISQGLGEAESRVRLWCPPEIVMLELGI
jgi:hypothetical protein